jgi:outer membrane protein OmpA-like peptidoglycan-associated protein
MGQVKAVSVALFVAVGFTASFGACGSSSSNGGAATTTTGGAGKEVSASVYVSKTNAACTSLQQQLTSAIKGVSATTAAGRKVIAAKYGELLHQAATELRNVGYPTGKQALASQFYDALDTAASKLEGDPELLAQTAEPAEFKRLDTLSKQLGITSCGSSG